MAPKPQMDALRHLPVSNYQLRMIGTATDPETSHHFHQGNTICWAFRIRPSVPQRTLRRAFDKLTERHESLRLKFVELAEGWRAEIMAKHPMGLIVEDLTALEPDAQDNIIRARAAEPMTAFSVPLFEMLLFRCGEAGDVVLTRAHHVIIDGYSVAIVIEDLLKIIINMPFGGKAPSHHDFIVQRLSAANERHEEKDSFWQNRLLPPPEKLRIGRVAKGLPPLTPQTWGPVRTMANILAPSESAALDSLVKRTGVTAFSLLHAAFCETICRLAGQDAVLVNSVMGRMNSDMTGFVGADMQALGIIYNSSSNNLEDRSREVMRQISEASDYCPNNSLKPGTDILNALEEAGSPWFRFLVHIPHPIGRMSSSPFRRLFNDTETGKVSVGFASIERFALPDVVATDCELQFNLTQVAGKPNATIIADEDGFSEADLEEIADSIKEQLRAATI